MSSVVITQARSNARILKADGLLLCSGVDPQREAKQWADRFEHEARQNSRFLIIGLGSGYHVLELRSRFPKAQILVIETREEIVTAANRIHSLELERVEVAVVASPLELLKHSRVKRWLRSAFLLCDFFPAQQADRETFADLKGQIVSRDPIFFAAAVASDERLKKLFQRWPVKGGPEAELLSIKSLNCMAPDAPAEDILLLKSLRELVV